MLLIGLAEETVGLTRLLSAATEERATRVLLLVLVVIGVIEATGCTEQAARGLLLIGLTSEKTTSSSLPSLSTSE